MYIYSRTVNIYIQYFSRSPSNEGYLLFEELRTTPKFHSHHCSLCPISRFHETKNRIFRRFRFSSCLEDRIEVLRIEYIVTISNMIQKTRSRSIILPIFLFIIYIFINYLLILIACIHL